jgi:hypothetical protein
MHATLKNADPKEKPYTEWAKSRYTVIFFSLQVLSISEKNHQYYTIYCILYTYFWFTLY